MTGDEDIQIARLDERMKQIQHDVAEIKEAIKPLSDYSVVRMMVFGTAGILLTAVLGAIVALVIK